MGWMVIGASIASSVISEATKKHEKPAAAPPLAAAAGPAQPSIFSGGPVSANVNGVQLTGDPNAIGDMLKTLGATGQQQGQAAASSSESSGGGIGDMVKGAAGGAIKEVGKSVLGGVGKALGGL